MRKNERGAKNSPPPVSRGLKELQTTVRSARSLNPRRELGTWLGIPAIMSKPASERKAKKLNIREENESESDMFIRPNVSPFHLITNIASLTHIPRKIAVLKVSFIIKNPVSWKWLTALLRKSIYLDAKKLINAFDNGR